jgi:alanine racemase
MYGIRQTFRNYSGVTGYFRKIRDVHIKKKLNISNSSISNDLEVAIGFALKAPVIEINRVYKGETVGYGGMFNVENDTHIAVIPVGYKDGIHLECRKSKVWINRKLYPIVGIINMCMITVEVDTEVSVGDNCVIFGGHICIKDIAALTNSTSYVVMTGISSNISRIYK